MSTITRTENVAPGSQRDGRSRRKKNLSPLHGRWRRFTILLIITMLLLVPIFAVIGLALQPALGSSTTSGITLENFVTIFAQTDVLIWLENSLGVTLAAVVVSVLVAAFAGYVLSRGRGRVVAGFSLLLFIVQSLPVVTAVIPLFTLFAKLGLVDDLGGITLVYIGATMSVATWMMAAYYDSIPINLEEAAWMDGCSVFGSFTRVVLRNSLPGVLSTSIFAFLLSWNDYLIALVFIRSDVNYTFPIGLRTFFQQNATNWGLVMAVAVVMMLPPIILFSALNKYFSVGGIGGSLAGQ